MICPHCNTTVPDGSTVCPHCSALIGASGSASTHDFIFCEGCGARLTPKDRTCPKCGRPAPGILSTEASAADLAAGKTASFPKLTDEDVRTRPSAAEVLDVSLDPSATNVLKFTDDAPATSSREEDPYHAHRRPVGKIVAAIAVVVLIGACAFFVVADPFGVMPGVYSEIERQAAEMFPSRQGAATQEQENGEAEEEETSPEEDEVELTDETLLTDDEAYDTLTRIYEEIGGYQDPLGDVIYDYNGGFLLSNLERRREASASAYALRDQVQATLDELSEINLQDGSPYTEDLDHLVQLATWMYNRVDVLCDSWDISLSYPDGESLSAHKSEISQPLRDALDGSGQNQNLTLFEENYYQWKPTQH